VLRPDVEHDLDPKNDGLLIFDGESSFKFLGLLWVFMFVVVGFIYKVMLGSNSFAIQRSVLVAKQMMLSVQQKSRTGATGGKKVRSV
jgi:hypothetical protein